VLDLYEHQIRVPLGRNPVCCTYRHVDARTWTYRLVDSVERHDSGTADDEPVFRSVSMDLVTQSAACGDGDPFHLVIGGLAEDTEFSPGALFGDSTHSSIMVAQGARRWRSRRGSSHLAIGPTKLSVVSGGDQMEDDIDPGEDLGPGKDLTGKLLVATPRLGDPNFARTVILVLEHATAGALGLVLNHPMGVPVYEILEPWSEEATKVPPAVMFSGGPVSPGAIIGLVRAPGIRQEEWQPQGWHQVLGGIGTVDLSVVPADQPPLDGARLFSGYSGWSADQLDDEIEEGAWFCLEAVETDLITDEPELLWHDVLQRQGGNIGLLATFPPNPSVN
jgi:putative transcriptional regulator